MKLNDENNRYVGHSAQRCVRALVLSRDFDQRSRRLCLTTLRAGAFRQHGVHPIIVDPALAERRRSINAFIRSLQADRIHVIEVDPLFVTKRGEMRFCDLRGRQLYQDRGLTLGLRRCLGEAAFGREVRMLLGTETSPAVAADVAPSSVILGSIRVHGLLQRHIGGERGHFFPPGCGSLHRS